jgi:hypothetical protein
MLRNFRMPLVYALLSTFLLISTGWADSLELKNGSLIKGKYLGGTETEITFRVGSTVQHYAIDDIASLSFDRARTSNPAAAPELTPRPVPLQTASAAENMASTTSVNVPSGTHVQVRTVDAVDSDRNQIGDTFQATLEQPLIVDEVTVAPKGADVYGRLSQVTAAGHIQGRSQLKLELTSLVVNGKTIPLVTGEYSAAGSSRGASTAKRVGGGAAAGALIGAIVGGGKGAAIGAGVGASGGAAVQVMTQGEQVHVPSETLLDFVLQQDVTIPLASNGAQSGR